MRNNLLISLSGINHLTLIIHHLDTTIFDGRMPHRSLRELSFLIGKCENLTVVTNEVFSGGADYDDESLRYMRTLADLNRELAAQADLVVEVVCGLPNVLKGELP